jgi:hypothetical protein
LPGPIESYLQEDHARLDGLRRSGAAWEFRGGLLRHIGIEERILLPDARKRRGGEPLRLAARLREDHSALATLLVPAPSKEIDAAIDLILRPHNALEEGPGGVYAECDELAGAEAEAIAERLRATPATPQREYQDGPLVRAQVARVLEWLAKRGG